MLDSSRLAVLVEIARAGSIAGAAQRLSFTPSAVSQQLGKLERDLGCQLVRRHPRGVTLTPAGRTLAAHAETVVGELRAAERSVRAMLGDAPPPLALGTFASVGQSLVPEALAGFRRSHPSVALRLMDLEPPDGYGLVSSADLDLLITHRYPGVPLPDPRGLQRGLLASDPLRLVLPSSHPEARSRRLALERLSADDWISGSSGVPNRACLEQLARSAGIGLRVAFETKDYQVTLALIEAGLGIALVPATVLRHVSSPRLAVRDLHGPAPARDIYLVHRKRPGMLVAEMIADLRDAAGATRSGSAGTPGSAG